MHIEAKKTAATAAPTQAPTAPPTGPTALPSIDPGTKAPTRSPSPVATAQNASAAPTAAVVATPTVVATTHTPHVAVQDVTSALNAAAAAAVNNTSTAAPALAPTPAPGQVNTTMSPIPTQLPTFFRSAGDVDGVNVTYAVRLTLARAAAAVAQLQRRNATVTMQQYLRSNGYPHVEVATAPWKVRPLSYVCRPLSILI